MAASTAAFAVAGSMVRNAEGASWLSSSSAFGTPLVRLAPARSVAERVVCVDARAYVPDVEQVQRSRVVRREMLAGLMVAGAALSTAASAFAASGPGTEGAKRTNEKAGDLLKAADTLTKEDSPPRYGPTQVGAVEDSNRIAQTGGAGSGAVKSLQDGASKAVEEGQSNVEEAKSGLGNLIQKLTGQ